MALVSGIIIGPCLECRWWVEPQAVHEPEKLQPGWRDCGKARESDAKMDTQGWDCDGGAVMTAPYFGCVQWERKPDA
jgi:hypothetical protein